MLSLAALAALVASAAALGINCNGSGGCPTNDARLSDILVQVKQLQAQGKGARHYKPGVQLACAKGQFASICAFYQRGGGGSADRAVELLQTLEARCQQCGSIPTQPGNDVTQGELTVNIASAPCCKGNCPCPV